MLLTLILLSTQACQDLATKQRLARQTLATQYMTACMERRGSLSFCLSQTLELVEGLIKEDKKELIKSGCKI